MKNSYRIILYLFSFIMILIGVALFLFHDQVLDSFEAKTDSLVSVLPAATPLPARDILDLSALESPRFKALVNNVINFNFDNICWRPDAGLGQPATGDGATSSALNCVQGNNTPFFANVK